MADPAHKLTDIKLEEMERRITAIYTRAEKEIQKTADDYFKQFKRLDEQKRKLVEAEQLSEQEYKTWRKNKMLYGKRFKKHAGAMRSTAPACERNSTGIYQRSAPRNIHDKL